MRWREKCVITWGGNNLASCVTCHTSNVELRKLPVGGGCLLYFCESCFDKEISERKERNTKISDFDRYEISEWESLDIVVEDICGAGLEE
jgi:hypothetical protein